MLLHKMQIFQFLFFCGFVRIICFFCIFLFFINLGLIFCANSDLDRLAPQNDRVNLSFVKDENTVGKNLARNGLKMAIYQLLFFTS